MRWDALSLIPTYTLSPESHTENFVLFVFFVVKTLPHDRLAISDS